jgi:alkylation response protein AidB-like acyl-CoA dehydrogenase
MMTVEDEGPGQQALVDEVGRVLDDLLPLARLHGDRKLPQEAQIWPRLAELGWFALGAAESAGGMAVQFETMLGIYRRLGRNLCTPSILATHLAVRLAPQTRSDLVQGLIAGAVRASFAIPYAAGAAGSSGECVLLDAAQAQLLLVWTGSSLCLVESARATRRREVQSLDAALAIEHGAIDTGSPMATAPGPLLAEADALSAALLVGLADAARTMAVNYAGQRIQFGRPIGSFQAIQHKCAEMAVSAEVAWAQCMFALLPDSNGIADAVRGAQAARLLAIDAAVSAAEANIQVHGGIGFTSQADPHLLVRRAQLLARIGADRSRLRRSLANRNAMEMA